MQKYYDYFLGATSPTGFADFFQHLCNNDSPLRTYIIKSGPGCGKSTMMRRIGARIIKSGHSIEFIHCSSDPSSLDGVICHELKFAIVDGTSPHDKNEIATIFSIAPRCAFDFKTIYMKSTSTIYTKNSS